MKNVDPSSRSDSAEDTGDTGDSGDRLDRKRTAEEKRWKSPRSDISTLY